MISESRHIYSAGDIIRILNQRSHEQDRSTPEGERMAYLLHLASLFLEYQEMFAAHLCEELGWDTSAHAVFSISVDLDADLRKEAARQVNS